MSEVIRQLLLPNRYDCNCLGIADTDFVITQIFLIINYEISVADFFFLGGGDHPNSQKRKKDPRE